MFLLYPLRTTYSYSNRKFPPIPLLCLKISSFVRSLSFPFAHCCFFFSPIAVFTLSFFIVALFISSTWQHQVNLLHFVIGFHEGLILEFLIWGRSLLISSTPSQRTPKIRSLSQVCLYSHFISWIYLLSSIRTQLVRS
jgi:hypothetical protein